MSLLKEATRRPKGQELLDQLDGFSGLRNGLSRMADERSDYSGCPIPIEGQRLVIEKTFKYKGIEDLGAEPEPKDDSFKVRNIWWSARLRCMLAIVEEDGGKLMGLTLRGSANNGAALLHTLGASDVWGIEQESAALNLLATLLPHRRFKQYLLTGSFLETSKRSGVTYVFRKLRPTVAVRSDGDGSSILCTLCMHPIGYYEESWAGCMCPTDDVISHLMMMRGDERMFWCRCEQHGPTRPESGL